MSIRVWLVHVPTGARIAILKAFDDGEVDWVAGIGVDPAAAEKLKAQVNEWRNAEWDKDADSMSPAATDVTLQWTLQIG